uniref:ORF6 n=1 Tax=Simian hemorrhagic fever virus TaxID=38143 RepID=L0CSC4_SHFV|nr:ORF6 [Simian hemorrhagic fever virus]
MAPLCAPSQTLQLHECLLQLLFTLLLLRQCDGTTATSVSAAISPTPPSAISNVDISSIKPSCIVCFAFTSDIISNFSAVSERDECLQQYNMVLNETVYLVETDSAALRASHCLALAASQYYTHHAYFRPTINQTVEYCWTSRNITANINAIHPGAIRWASVLLLFVYGLKYRALST